MRGKWKLVRERVDEDDAHDDEDEGHVVAVVEGGSDGGEKAVAVFGAFAEGEEVGGGEGPVEEGAELEHHGHEAEGGLLDHQGGEEVGVLDDVEVLEKELEVAEVFGDGAVDVVAGGDGESGDEEHVDEHVGELAVHDAAVVQRKAGVGFEGGW